MLLRLPRPGMCWPPCAIRLTSTSPAQRPGPISRVLLVLLHQRTAPAVSESALSRAITIPSHASTSGFFICCGCFPGASIFRPSPNSPSSRWTAPDATRLLALCWAGFILVFFTFSTTQEYYSMPCYPALALLLGSAMAADGKWMRRGTRVLTPSPDVRRWPRIVILVLEPRFACARRYLVGLEPAPRRLQIIAWTHGGSDPGVVRLPSRAAGDGGSGFPGGRRGHFQSQNAARCRWRPALMMVLFFHAARVAMVAFDPYMSSRPLAEALEKAPQGTLIVDRHYYTGSLPSSFTPIVRALLNGRIHESRIRVVCSRRAGRFHRRCAIQESVAPTGTCLHRGEESAVPRLEGSGG